MIHLSYGRLEYPNENYINSLMRHSHLKYTQCLAIVIIVGHRAAIPARAGYRYDTGDTKTYLDGQFEALDRWKVGQEGLLLKDPILFDRSGRVPCLMKEHAKAMELQVDEEAMYEPLVELVRGRGVGKLLIEPNYTNIIHMVDLTRNENG